MSMTDFQKYCSQVLPSISFKSVQAVVDLHKEGATVPFIARYRKEKTGNLDEVQVHEVIQGHESFEELMKRQAFILKEIESQGNLSLELKERILKTIDLGELEELYRPFKKKKKTKATEAREAGLEPLANWIWDLGNGKSSDSTTLEVKAKEFINPAKKFVTYEEVLKGAQDILVERISNQASLRELVLKDFLEHGRVKSKVGKKYKPHSKFEMYSEFEEPVKRLMEPKASHRYLAMRRGWQEEELAVTVESPNQVLLEKSFQDFARTTKGNAASDFLERTAVHALNIHTIPSIVNEVHRRLKDLADDHAIQVFAENVRKLLLSSPFGAKCVLGVDPGLRTGCKVALLDKGGNFLTHTVIHTHGEGAVEKLKTLFQELVQKVQIDAIAVGNGTNGRETETVLRKVLTDIGSKVPVILVNESGASIYSASEVAREEFPEMDITVRGAISIARRLQDPLAELVKIDPKSIGVGQYQHDVNQSKLKKGLDFVVESCVNSVGVDLNTASPYLLGYVSGIGPALAKAIVEHRKTAGLFTDRDSLLKVPKFSSKAFEQAAGFLRVHGGSNPLDQTGIHPERYLAVKEMASELGCTLSQLIGEGAKKLTEQRTKWVQLVGEFTFDDIVKDLERPGRDPRDPFKVFSFRDDIFETKDLKEGMQCPGIVTNVTNFGAFVDIGVHQDGLVHISELSDKFVDDPKKVVSPGDQVQVKVLKVDLEKNQISLTMKLNEARAAAGVSEGAPGEMARPQRERRPPRDPRPNGEVWTPKDRKPAGERPPRAEAGGKPSGRFGGDQRGPRPQGDSKEFRGSRDGGAGGRGGGQSRGGGQPQKGFAPKSPFNNSFGGLAALKDQLKK